jgi:hypothetical protein
MPPNYPVLDLNPKNPVIDTPFKRTVPDATFEPHFTITQLHKTWGVGRETVRKLIREESGVVKIQLGKKKANVTYTVPESVARRIHNRLTAPIAA